MSSTQMIELAIAAGRKKQSAQTGYVHICYNAQEEEIQYTIPLVENFLFALALFRSKTTENILEAKGIIERLLEFQCFKQGVSEGNFPIYLHEYPECKDRFIGAHLLPSIFWILKQFQQVLGNELKIKLENAARALVLFSIRALEEKPAPSFIGIKIAAAAKALGELWNDPSLREKGEKLLRLTRDSIDPSSWYIPSQLGDICVALQMADPSISSSWTSFWEHLNNNWHPLCMYYMGPSLQEFQKGEEPQTTLYDLFLGSFSGNFSQRSFSDPTLLLQAALIQKSDDFLLPPAFPLKRQISIDQHNWSLYGFETYSYCFLDACDSPTKISEKGFSPLKIVWGNSKKAHTFVCQGGNISHLEIKKVSNGMELFFTLGELPTDEREKCREVAFYFDASPGTQINIAKGLSTTFKIEEEIEIIVESLKFYITYELLEGTGQFLGHIMRGNRPSQTGLKGSQRFNAYDWQVFLRTIRRTTGCKIKVSIKIVNNT